MEMMSETPDGGRTAEPGGGAAGERSTKWVASRVVLLHVCSKAGWRTVANLDVNDGVGGREAEHGEDVHDGVGAPRDDGRLVAWGQRAGGIIRRGQKARGGVA